MNQFYIDKVAEYAKELRVRAQNEGAENYSLLMDEADVIYSDQRTLALIWELTDQFNDGLINIREFANKVLVEMSR